MKLEIASWNNGTSSYNALAEETNIVNYTIHHEFNKPAICTIALADADGSLFQTYNVDDNDVYVGPGKVELEDPTGTDLFKGRILGVRHDWDTKQTVLTCQDWMHQLTEERIDYDMRENIDGAGLRESTISSNTDASTYGSSYCFKPIEAAGSHAYMFDNDMNQGWDDDQWNGYYVIFPPDAFGNITTRHGPFDESFNTTMDTDTPDDGEEQVWEFDDNSHNMADDDLSSFTLTYNFKNYVKAGSLYSAVTGARIILDYKLDGYDSAGLNMVRLVNQSGGNDTIVGGPLDTNNFRRQQTFEVPTEAIDASVLFDSSTSESEIEIVIAVDTGNTSTFDVYAVFLEVDYTMDAESHAWEISDTYGIKNRLYVLSDGSGGLDDRGFYEGCPYAIARELRYRVDNLAQYTALHADVDLTASVESTTAISTSNFERRTRYEILEHLSFQDQTVFWVPLGTLTFNWKKTTDDSSTAISDDDVLAWRAKYDYEDMRNEYLVYGIRVGDNQLYADSGDLGTDPGADSKSKYGVTKDEIVRAKYITEYECEETAKALVERDEDVQLYLEATIDGLSSIRLGDYLEVTSTHLGLTTEAYTVVRWEYNSRNYTTTIELHPRGTIGYRASSGTGRTIEAAREQSKKALNEQYVPEPHTQVI